MDKAMKEDLLELAGQLDKLADIVTEHNKSLNILHDTLTKMNDEMTAQRAKIAQIEAKLAYYAEGKENGGRIIQ